jgi:predicted nucleic acid-binding protein
VIAVDTNVIYEMMRTEPDATVLAWVNSVGRLHTTAVSVAEIGYGIARLPSGLRRDSLASTAALVFADFADLVWPFDARAARRFGAIVVGREQAGRPIATADAQIAAICASRDATLATRNTADFADTGITVVNPWNLE